MNKNFNIQLFAENLNTTATMSKEMKTFYEKRLIDQAEPRLVHDQFADYYPVPQNGGKTIEFRKYDSLPKASTPLTEGVTPNGQALNVTTITSDLHQYGQQNQDHFSSLLSSVLLFVLHSFTFLLFSSK